MKNCDWSAGLLNKSKTVVCNDNNTKFSSLLTPQVELGGALSSYSFSLGLVQGLGAVMSSPDPHERREQYVLCSKLLMKRTESREV